MYPSDMYLILLLYATADPGVFFPLVGLGEYALLEIQVSYSLFLFVLRFHYTALTGLELTVWARLALNS